VYSSSATEPKTCRKFHRKVIHFLRGEGIDWAGVERLLLCKDSQDVHGGSQRVRSVGGFGRKKGKHPKTGKNSHRCGKHQKRRGSLKKVGKRTRGSAYGGGKMKTVTNSIGVPEKGDYGKN